jgi:transposase
MSDREMVDRVLSFFAKNGTVGGMGRRRTQLDLSAAERAAACQLLRSCQDRRAVERLRFTLLAATGRHTLEGLSRRLGRSRSTIQNWLGKFAAGGLESLLERDTSPGVSSPIAGQTVLKQLQAGLKAGRWTSAAHVAAWLREAHGIARSRKSIYYWFEKCGLRPSSRKPEQPGRELSHQTVRPRADVSIR